MPLPADIYSRIYAGVLGKIIGVYLGRPFEQWTYERITRELGEIHYYVNGRLKVPLVVTDDDITGTFTFIRALEDNAFDPALTPAQIGHNWLNYIIKNKTILWWGGIGTSSEHTAFDRLSRGIDAPASGSIALNGKTIAEQIGAQIFIDGWGMVCAGDPALAADFARRAGSVSHDGEAIYAAQVIAAIEAAAFVEHDLDRLLDIGVSFIPAGSMIATLIADLRRLRRTTDDWRVGLARIHEVYSYELFKGVCHVVPNHAVVMLGLLWGDGDFDSSLMITNTAGYDTDCNAANVGCILGIRNGLGAVNARQDWRGPVADRVLLPTADGGSCVTDALTIATSLTRAAYRLRGLAAPTVKDASRFHFSLPGSVQGFTPDLTTPLLHKVCNLNQSLELHFRQVPTGLVARATTPTFATADQLSMTAYSVVATPTLYSGQQIHTRLRSVDGTPRIVRLVMRHYDPADTLVYQHGQIRTVTGEWSDLEWTCPDTQGQPITEIGFEIVGPTSEGAIEVDRLDWTGSPTVTFERHAGSQIWRRGWVEAGHGFNPWFSGFLLIENDGTGLAIAGTRQWANYKVSTNFTPGLCEEFGLVARVQGQRRFVGLVIGSDRRARLVEMLHTRKVLAEIAFDWEFDQAGIPISVEVMGDSVTARVGPHTLVGKINPLLSCGGIATVCTNGSIRFGPVVVEPPG